MVIFHEKCRPNYICCAYFLFHVGNFNYLHHRNIHAFEPRKTFDQFKEGGGEITEED